MSKPKSKEELIKQKESAIQCLESFLDTLIDSGQMDLCGKADKFSYWMKDYIKFLEYEPKFNSAKLRRYKRGEVIKVHLGYNIGSEEGGLHYCTVLDKNNSLSMPIITVVPLTSVKKGMDTSRLHKGEVFLGNELFTCINSKFISQKSYVEDEIKALNDLLDSSKNGDCDKEKSQKLVIDRLEELKGSIALITNMQREIQKMRRGSIADISQITTVSKIRIYDPKTDNDVLSNIKLSNESLNMIDNCINELFIK